MVGTNMVEELDCGNFFDQIDDLLEFPNADIENGFVGNGISSLWPDPASSLDSELLKSDSFFSHSPSDLSTELSAPYDDIVQLEWLSTFVEDSFSSKGLTLDKSLSSSPNQFQTSSPVSVLESSRTCSDKKPIPITHEKRARTKRPRPATFTPRLSIIQPTSSISSETEPQKKKKIKILQPSGSIPANQNQNENHGKTEHPYANEGVRKCMHCAITKTPQWRTGPMGPKSLCNACGVRYKSGRLFPEYRPAASPTFVPTLHSNSHKKVIEMRTKNKPSTA